MVSRLKSTKTLLMSLLALVLVMALACSSDDEAAETTTAPAAPAAPAGPTAAEIAEAVKAIVPEGVSASAISDMIDSAISANPGVTAAQLQAAVEAGAGDDLTPAQVSAIVKSALDSLPAPQVDTSAIAGLVSNAVASAISDLPEVPEGVDAAQISALVAAAVKDATTSLSSAGDVSAAIASALSSQDNLTAEQVAAIVDASLKSLREGVAAQGAAIAALEEGVASQGVALAALPKLEASEGGFSKVLLPELERPTNIPRNPALAPKQELTYLYSSQPQEGIRPPWLQGSNDEAIYRWVFMTPFLLASPANNFDLRQGYATGYSLSDDGLTYLFHINPDAIFQDGTPITAQSVKDAWEWSAIVDNQSPWGSILRHTRFIEGIAAIEVGDAMTASGLTAIDALTLEIKLTQVVPTWPLRTTIWTFGHFSAEQAANDSEGFRLNPIGVGPYRGSYDDATVKHTYTATANWWGPAPFIKVIHRPTVPDLQTGYIMYENGELDILFADSARQPAFWDPANPYHGDLKARGGKDSPSLWFARFVTDHPPFDDVNVRKAFAHGGDMKSIIPAILGPKAAWGAGLITSGNRCWQPDTGYAYDPALAKQALADSKYGGPENLPSITIELARPSIIRIFEVLQEQWKDNLGVEINLVRLEPGQQRRDVTEMARGSAAHRVPDPSILLSTFMRPKGPDAKLDAMIEPALSLPIDTPGYCETWHEIERHILDLYYHLPLHGGDFASWAVQPWVHGYVPTWGDGFGTMPWWVIGTRDRSLYE